MKKILSITLLSLALFANDKSLEVFESPSCGCCEQWIAYMKKKGYALNVHKSNDFYKIKQQFGIKPEYQSCHTAIVAGYTVEGHVPESAVKWLLETKPKEVIGVSAPGMPQGSPGMEQGSYEEYPVIVMKKDGSYELFGYFKGEELVRKK